MHLKVSNPCSYTTADVTEQGAELGPERIGKTGASLTMVPNNVLQ